MPDYKDGPEAIRRADPNYDPRRDPDMRQASQPCASDGPQPEQPSQCPVYWTLGGVLLVTLRFFLPDVYLAVKWLGKKCEGKAHQELAALKAELQAMKQTKPAA